MTKIKDLKGVKVGRLEAIEIDKTKKGYMKYWVCKCDCGNYKSVRVDHLTRKEVYSCGCHRKKEKKVKIKKEPKILKPKKEKENLVGKKFGRLTVLNLDHEKNKTQYWLCLCECGNTKVVPKKSLKNGGCKSCGCLNSETSSENLKKLHENGLGFKHGHSKTRLYHTWTNMKYRCFNPKSKDYRIYGARGIKVCDEWKNDYKVFYEWSIENGYNDSLSIDRIDVNGDYSPENCRWITMKEQAKNKQNKHLITYNGRTQNMEDWAREINIGSGIIFHRLKNGWSVEKELTTPLNKRGKANE